MILLWLLLALPPVNSPRFTPLVEVVDRVSPAVVSIISTTPPRSNPFFKQFKVDPRSLLPKREESTSLGTGIIVESSGYIITNFHVVVGATEIKVKLANGQKLPATLIGAEENFDLAFLKITTKTSLPVIKFGDSKTIVPGEPVVAIGNPLGIGISVTTGVISAAHRVLAFNDIYYDEMIQTDAAINPGNSGGPLLNAEGDLIGMNTALRADGQNIAFAIPSNRIKSLYKDVLQYRKGRIGWVGIVPKDIITPGVEVGAVEENSPAAKAGIKAGDVIFSVNDSPVETAVEFYGKMGHIFTEPVRFNCLSGNKIVQPIILEPVALANRAINRLGILYLPRPEGLAVLFVKGEGIASQKGFIPGDLIKAVGDVIVTTDEGFKLALGAVQPGSFVVLTIKRGIWSYLISFRV